jgi:putative transposase
MAAAIGLRGDFDAGALRAAAKRSKDGRQARRLLALAAIYEGPRAARRPRSVA